MSAHCTRLDKIIEGLFICLPKFGSHFKSCHFGGLSQNFAAKILATYFGNLFWHAKLWQLFCHKKVAISKSCHLGGLRKNFAAKILASYFGMPNFGMPKSGNFFGSHFKSCHLGGLRNFFANGKKNVTLKGCQIMK